MLEAQQFIVIKPGMDMIGLDTQIKVLEILFESERDVVDLQVEVGFFKITFLRQAVAQAQIRALTEILFIIKIEIQHHRRIADITNLIKLFNRDKIIVMQAGSQGDFNWPSFIGSMNQAAD